MAEEKTRGAAKGQQNAPAETKADAPAEAKPSPASPTSDEPRRDAVVTAPDRKKNGAQPETPAPDATATRPGRGRATETPVILPPPPRTTEYVVTVDNRTNIPLKIERLDERTGERKELSDSEYRLVFPAGRPRTAAAMRKAPLGTTFSGGAAEPSSQEAALMEAYYRGVADYIRALTSMW